MTEIKPIRKPKLAIEEVMPTVLVDSREQTPLIFTNLPSEVKGLESGDYSLKGMEHEVSIERKSVPDLVACVCGENRDRFFRELTRLRGYRFVRLLVVGSILEIEQQRYRASVHPNAVLGTLSTIEVRFLIPVVFIPTPEAASKAIERWFWYLARDHVKRLQTFIDGMAVVPAPE